MFIVDIDNDVDLDLLITTDSGNDASFSMNYFKQDIAKALFEQKINLTISRVHPTIVDIDGDHKFFLK